MSTAVATPPSQLCFPWMQSEPFSSRAKSRLGKGARNPENQANIEQVEVGLETEISDQRTTAAENALSLRDGMRVGQVRIGIVMLSLLKKYGITDQEISEVLATIAQENCQGLAS